VLEEHDVLTAWGCWAKAADKPRAINAVKMATYFDDIWVPPNLRASKLASSGRKLAFKRLFCFNVPKSCSERPTAAWDY
jgi:hypothetical protein